MAAPSSPLPAEDTPDNYRLTKDVLKQHVPVYQAGLAARRTLNAPATKLNTKQRKALQAQIHAGDQARDKLISDAMPLLKRLAHLEHRKRSHWGTRVELEDLLQEACYGFIRGLAVFDVEKIQASPSMYLAQWANATMRRNADRTESDLATPSDLNQRWKVIKAVRSRLRNELEREPTDEEIVTATQQPTSQNKSAAKLGKIGEERSPNITFEEIAEERKYSTATSAALRIVDDTDNNDNAPYGTVRAASIHHNDELEDDPAHGMRDVFITAMTAAEFGETQMGIISQFHGLPPYDRPAPSAAAVATAHGITQVDTQKVLDAYTTIMAKPGGPLHQVALGLSAEHRSATGLDWVTKTLGEQVPPTIPDVPTILVSKLNKRRVATMPAGEPGNWMAYQCPTHARPFIMRVPPKQEAPREWPCPTCQSPSVQVAGEAR